MSIKKDHNIENFALFKYRNLMSELVKRDIKTKYRRSVLGILWSMLNPLLTMLIMSMVFSTLFRSDIDNFIVYLLSGSILFSYFSEATNFAMGAILQNAPLIKKVYVPKYLFPISRVMSCGVNLLLTLPAVFVIMLVTRHPINFKTILIIIPLVLVFLFNIGVGLLLSSLVVFFRDVFHLYGVVVTGLMYATPIFYPISIVPDKYMRFIRFNPMLHFVNLFRQILYYNNLPDPHLVLRCALIALLSIVVGGIFFNIKQRKFILFI